MVCADLGQDTVDTKACHVWTKSDGFIRYWADQHTGNPVRWIFFDGAQFEVLSWKVNETLADEEWQAPPMCFNVSGKRQVELS